jgi:hypothetical protein
MHLTNLVYGVGTEEICGGFRASSGRHENNHREVSDEKMTIYLLNQITSSMEGH